MHTLFRFLLMVALLAAPAFAARNIGDIEKVVDGQTIPVRVIASSPDLQKLAQDAFNSHGRYKLVGSGQAYDFRFTAAGANQVRVDITKGTAATPVAAQMLSGRTLRQALLRAADFAVEKTNGLSPSLRGFFTARLAFVSEKTGRSEVFATDLFLGEAKQLTHEGAHVLSPRWAPDGSKVIYTSYYKSHAPDIFVQDPVSGSRNVFADFKGTNTGARFSPNGQQVAMVLTVEGPSEIYVRNAQGGPPSRKTRIDAPKSSPCWSPDGSQIVFAMGESSQLYVISAGGGGTPRRIGSGYTYMAEPDWSRANPNKIVCTVRESGRYQIAVVDVATGKTEVVSKADFDAIEPSWLADGRHVICTFRDRRTSVIKILDTVTGSSFPITSPTDGAARQAGVWTP